MGDTPRAICGAHSRRTGNPCKGKPMANGRCRMHGGLSTGAPVGNKNAVTHGIYAKGLRADEHELWETIEIGSIDDEIRLLKLQLRRAVEAQLQAESNPSGAFELKRLMSKRSEGGGNGKGGGSETSTTREAPDFRDLVLRLTNKIATLTKLRDGLGKNGGGAAAAQADENFRAAKERVNARVRELLGE